MRGCPIRNSVGDVLANPQLRPGLRLAPAPVKYLDYSRVLCSAFRCPSHSDSFDEYDDPEGNASQLETRFPERQVRVPFFLIDVRSGLDFNFTVLVESRENQLVDEHSTLTVITTIRELPNEGCFHDASFPQSSELRAPRVNNLQLLNCKTYTSEA